IDYRPDLEAERLPAALGGEPCDAARLVRTRWRAFIDPGATGVAVDSSGREIAQPARLAQLAATAIQDRIAGRRLGWHAAQDVRHPGQGGVGQGTGAVEQVGRDAFGGQPIGLVVRGDGTRDRPAAGPSQSGNFEAAEAHTEYEKTTCHLVRIVATRFFSNHVFLPQGTARTRAQRPCPEAGAATRSARRLAASAVPPQSAALHR